MDRRNDRTDERKKVRTWLSKRGQIELRRGSRAPRTRKTRSREPSEREKSRARPFENLKEGANGSVRAQKVRCEPQRKAQRVGMPEASIGIIVREIALPLLATF